MMTVDTRTELMLNLRDGRQLSYADFGDQSGKPIFYNHSGSRLDLRAASPVAAALGVRLIALDRPGIGLSDFRPGYQILDWPDDLAEAADQLELDRFSVLGHSAGAVFSLACAYKLPDRVTRCGLVGAPAPLDAPGVTEGMHRFNRALFSITRRTSWPMKAQAVMMARLMKSVDDQRASQQALKILSGPDKEAILQHPELLDDMLAAGREAFRSGTDGAVHSNLLVARPWGFPPEQIRVPVFIWHGREDTNAPPVMAEYLDQVIPDSHLRVMADEGHMSSLTNHMEEILTVLVAAS